MARRILFCIFICLAAFQTNAQLKEGYYFTKDGKKVSGLLQFNYGGMGMTKKAFGDCWVTFRTDKNSRRKILTTKDISSFVIEKDSFTILTDFKVSKLKEYKIDFIKVLEKGRIVLYEYPSYFYVGLLPFTQKDWFVLKEGKLEKISKSDFKTTMAAYLIDYPDLAKKIADDQLGPDDTPKIIQTYNSHFTETGVRE